MSGALDDLSEFNAAMDSHRGPGGGLPPGDSPGVAGDDLACPVECLGHRDGVHYFFDPRGQVRALSAEKLGNRAHLDVLFCGEEAWAVSQAPALDQTGVPTGDYQVKTIARLLIRRNSAIGLFEPGMPRRSIGAWRDGDGAVAVHLGDVVVDLATSPPARRRAGFRQGDALWPAAPAVLAAREHGQDRFGWLSAPASAEAAAKVEALFARWNWGTHPQAAVMFGLWAAHLLGAGSKWRPHGLVVGPPGSGKTTLMELYTAASPLACYLNDFTEAGIRQMLTGCARPLLLDEAEGDAEGANRLQRVIELLRRASGGSGAQSVRGSPGGLVQRFEVSSPAMLGAVLPPVLLPQDASRITRLDLHPRLQGGPGLPSAAEIAGLRRLAPRLWGRALAGIGRMERNLVVVRDALLARGCAPRLADQLGTIIAARAMMLSDAVLDAAEADEAVQAVAWLALSEADQAADAGPAACLTHLLQSAMDVQWNGERPTVGEALRRAVEPDADRERRALVEHGLLLAPWPRKSGGDPWLYVADRHPRLGRVFEGTQWAGGRWREDLRRLAGAVVPDNPQWIGQAKPRCTVLPPALLPERAAHLTASIECLEGLASEYGLGPAWVVGALKARWSPENARVEAREASMRPR